MVGRMGIRAAQTRFLNRVQARLAARETPAKGFISQPEPRSIGSVARGRQVLAGNLFFSGQVIETAGRSPWDIDLPEPAVADALHGFGWLDDLAAIGDVAARQRGQAWLWDWIDHFGRGTGPGWTPELAGRRLIRLVHHALVLLRGTDAAQARAYFQSIAMHMRFLSRRAHAAGPGLPRFEAWGGLLYAALSIEGADRYVGPAQRALAQESARHVDEKGGIPTRNPEELLDVFTLLTWVRLALEEAGREQEPAIEDAIQRIAPTLRMLRHADGGLARFHGGGRGLEGHLDTALAASGVKRRPPPRQAMGYARLSAGRTSVLVDADVPPRGLASAQAHASTLAFELTSGRRPLIVNCGAGLNFGADWRQAGRATPSHSTLCVQGYSSARLAAPRNIGGVPRELLEAGPSDVPVQMQQRADGWRFEGGHDGYVALNGLTHARSLHLSLDGRTLEGEDYLVALDAAAKKRFEKAMDQTRLAGIGFDIRFHLHPDVDVALDMGDTAVSMALRSGEIWLLRFDGVASPALEPSVYLENGRIQPRATKQIVLSGRAMEYATRVRWTLAKAQDTALAVRDMAREELDSPE